MENILSLITVNNDENDNNELGRGTMNHAQYPFQLSEISLPRDVSGYVYMLISLRNRDFFMWERQRI